jgi:ABC-type polysaccharide/polyol phosphate transport system ATPase subunit
MSAAQQAYDARQEDLVAAGAAVEVDNLTKLFRLPRQQVNTLKERVIHPLRSREYDEFAALKDISVTIANGEFFGIVGRNGSGKSTLLKCLAGIYRPNHGSVAVHGGLSPFIELGVGFNPDLAALDNVVINAVMMGMSRKDARARFDDIIRFAELEEFVDLKLKNYSSGMAVRLGFATAIQAEAEVLLVDEVLAVGDAAFQQKCFEEFARLKDEGRTIVFVTHDMGAVERFCDRALLIERGAMHSIGDPRDIAREYNELNFGRLVHDTVEEGPRYGDHAAAEIVQCWVENDQRQRVADIAQGERLVLALALNFHTRIEDPIFGFAMRNAMGHTVFATTSEWQEQPVGSFEGGTGVIVRVALDAYFAAGLYNITPSIARSGSGANAIDLREDLASFYIHATRETGGVVDLPSELTIEVL